MHTPDQKEPDIRQAILAVQSTASASPILFRHLNCAMWSIIPRLLVGIGIGIGMSVTSAAQPAVTKTNTVILSASALETMGVLISIKPGRSAKDVAATGSMRPVFDENYILIVEEKRFEDLAFGDIVIFRGDWLNGKPVAHRLIQQVAYGRAWQTKGDHCRGPDPQYFTREKYKGCIAVAAIHKRTGDVKPLIVQPN